MSQWKQAREKLHQQRKAPTKPPQWFKAKTEELKRRLKEKKQ